MHTLIHDSLPDRGYKEGSERVGLWRYSRQSFVFVSKKIMIKINLKKREEYLLNQWKYLPLLDWNKSKLLI